MRRVSILIPLLILTACAAAVESPTPSPSPTATATLTPSATATPSTTPTPTATFIPSNTPPPTVTPTITATPEFHNPNPGGDIFFTPYDDDDCQLPCWQGLRIGESTIDDIQVMFDRVFGLTVSEESFFTYLEDNPARYEVAGTKMVSYWWEWSGITFFAIDVVVDPETEILQGLHFTQIQDDDTILNPYTPEQVIEFQGYPESIHVSSSVAEHAVIALIYEKGLVFQYIMDATISEVSEENQKPQSEFCLGGLVQAADYYVIPSFDLDKDDIYPRSWFWWFLSAKSSEAVLGLSAEEIGEMALQSDNPCFTIEEPQ